MICDSSHATLRVAPTLSNAGPMLPPCPPIAWQPEQLSVAKSFFPEAIAAGVAATVAGALAAGEAVAELLAAAVLDGGVDGAAAAGDEAAGAGPAAPPDFRLER